MNNIVYTVRIWFLIDINYLKNKNSFFTDEIIEKYEQFYI